MKVHKREYVIKPGVCLILSDGISFYAYSLASPMTHVAKKKTPNASRPRAMKVAITDKEAISSLQFRSVNRGEFIRKE